MIPFRLHPVLDLLVLLGVSLTVLSHDAAGQENGPDKTESVASTPSDMARPAVRLERIQQDAIVLVDADTGRSMIALPNSWTPELIDAIGKYMLRDQENMEPAFTIHDIDAVGTSEHDKTRITFHFQITTRNDSIVRIPLCLKEGVLLNSNDTGGKTNDQRQEATLEHRGDGKADLVVDPEGGYAVLIRNPASSEPLHGGASASFADAIVQQGAPPDGEDVAKSTGTPGSEKRAPVRKQERDLQHELKLTLWFPVETVEDESKLAVSFPDAVRSQLVLTVPLTDATASVSQGTLFQGNVSPEENGTTFNLRGLKKNFEIAWRKKKPTVRIENRAVLTVEDANIAVRLAEDRIDYDVLLPIRCLNGTLDSFRLRLPPGVRLLQETVNDPLLYPYTINRVVPEESKNGEEEQKQTEPAKNDKEQRDGQHDGQRDDPAGEGGTEIEVKPLERFPGVINFHFRATKSLDNASPGEATESIVGFDVLGADKQTGTLSVELSHSERRLRWKTVRGIERSEPSEMFPRRPGETRFEFFTQPFLLNLRISEPRTRINVRPEYVVCVEKDRVRLTGKLSYMIHGSKAEVLRIRIPGWSNPEVGPFHLVDVANVTWENDTLLIPLQEPQEGNLEIELEVSQATPPLSTDRTVPIRIPIPDPEADSRSLAAVAVVPADCIQIFPRDNPVSDNPVSDNAVSNASVSDDPESGNNIGGAGKNDFTFGLVKTIRRSLQQFRTEIPPSQQAPLIYRTETSGAVFVGDLLYHRQQVSVNASSEIRLLQADDQVIQTFHYSILYERLEDLYLYVPKKLDESGRWRAYLDGRMDQPLDSRTVPTAPKEQANPDYVKKRIRLDRIGGCTLTLIHSFDPIDIARDFSSKESISFILPAEVSPEEGIAAVEPAMQNENADTTEMPDIFGARFPQRMISGMRHQTLDILVGKGIDVSLFSQAQSNWRPEKSPLSLHGDPQIFRFTSPRWEESINILVSQEGRDVLGTTVVDRAWIQSWLGKHIRTDQFTFQFVSNRDSVTVYIPSGVSKSQIAVHLDGRRIESQLFASGEIIVPLLPEQRGKTHTLEMWYKLPLDRTAFPMNVELPHFDTDVMLRCMYWQVVLPRNEHMVGVPDGWTPEYQWGWSGLFWGRHPSRTQEDIGLRVGSTQSIPGLNATNRYLLGTLQQPFESKLYVCKRGTILFIGSGIALLVGLLLIHVPATRYTGSLFGLGVVLLATVLYRPAPMLLLLQASILGIVLALSALYLDRLLRRNDRWTPGPGKSAAPESLDQGESSPSNVFSVIVDETGESPHEEQMNDGKEEG